MTNGKGGAVVQPGLAGEREAQPVAVVGVGQLHVGGEHRIGRREDRAEQHRGAERQAEQQDAGERRRRATVTAIETTARRTGSSQRPSLRPTLIFRPEVNSDSSTTTSAMCSSSVDMVERLDRGKVEDQRADGDADEQVEHRGAQRQARQHRVAERHHHQQQAHDGRPQREFHSMAPRNRQRVLRGGMRGRMLPVSMRRRTGRAGTIAEARRQRLSGASRRRPPDRPRPPARRAAQADRHRPGAIRAGVRRPNRSGPDDPAFEPVAARRQAVARPARSTTPPAACRAPHRADRRRRRRRGRRAAPHRAAATAPRRLRPASSAATSSLRALTALRRLQRAGIALVRAPADELARQQARVALERHPAGVAGVQVRDVHAGVEQQRHAGMQHVGHRRIDPLHRRRRSCRRVAGTVRELAADRPRRAERGEGARGSRRASSAA